MNKITRRNLIIVLVILILITCLFIIENKKDFQVESNKTLIEGQNAIRCRDSKDTILSLEYIIYIKKVNKRQIVISYLNKQEVTLNYISKEIASKDYDYLVKKFVK